VWREELPVAAALKACPTVTNLWLATILHPGNLHAVSRKVNAWKRWLDSAFQKLR